MWAALHVAAAAALEMAAAAVGVADGSVALATDAVADVEEVVNAAAAGKAAMEVAAS